MSLSGQKLLMVSNQLVRWDAPRRPAQVPDEGSPADWWAGIASTDWYAGFAEVFSELIGSGPLSAFDRVYPRITATTLGDAAAREELARMGEEIRPDIVLVISPNGFGHERAWVRRFLQSAGGPTVLYYDGDPWNDRVKRIDESMEAWLSVADAVFTVAREPHWTLFRKHGASDVRYIPHTYCQVTFREAEETPPERSPFPGCDVVMIGSRLARWGRVSRMPGAVARANLVRGLQRRPDISLALYGHGWKGRGVKGTIPYAQQATAIRKALLSVNWDHFPRHESYASDRLPISLLAGRVHVTTAHPRMEWLPGRQIGVFQEPTPEAVIERVEQVKETGLEEVIELGMEGYRWVRDRLSHRQAARYMLGAADRDLLRGLPEEPWGQFVAEWRR